METLKYILLFSLINLYLCCGTSSQSNAQNKAKNTSEVRSLLAAFEKQEHRLEINDCEILYNGKPFFLGDTLEEVEGIIGEKYDEKYYLAHIWKEIDLKITTKKDSDKIRSIYIYIYI